MDDDNDGIIFPPGMPEEFQAAVRHQISQQRMQSVAVRHDIQRFFSELSVEQTGILMALFDACGDDPGAAHFYKGVAAATLLHKHNVCPGCGVNHEEEAHDVMGTVDGIFPEVPPDSKSRHPSNDLAADPYTLYNVRDAGNGVVACLGCGKHYLTLEDRMRDKPGVEGCEGCIEKAKWG